MKMWKSLTFVIVLISSASDGAPTEATLTMYQAVVQKCPAVNNTNIKDHNEFLNCTNFTQINATKEYSVNRRLDLQCLLFYDALVSFCTEMGEFITAFSNFGSLHLKNIGIESVCGKSDPLFPPDKKFEHSLVNIFSKGSNCYQLCLNELDRSVSSYCQLSLLYATLNTTKLREAEEKSIHKNITSHNITNNIPAIANKSDNVASKQSLEIDSIQQHQLENKVDIENMNADLSSDNLEQHEVEGKDIKNKIDDLQIVKDDANPGEKLLKKPVKTEAETADSPKQIDPMKHTKLVTAKFTSTTKVQKSNNIVDKNEDNVEDQVDNIDQQGDDEDEQEQEFPKKSEPAMPLENEDDIGMSELEQVRKEKPHTLEDEPVNSFDTTEDMNGDSYFFSYFTVVMCLVIVGYVGYHNRQKVLALILEGKKGRRQTRSRRPNSANYHKLDSNLEEAISSSCTKSTTNVIY